MVGVLAQHLDEDLARRFDLPDCQETPGGDQTLDLLAAFFVRVVLLHGRHNASTGPS